jgi:hypothetical protein
VALIGTAFDLRIAMAAQKFGVECAKMAKSLVQVAETHEERTQVHV